MKKRRKHDPVAAQAALDELRKQARTLHEIMEQQNARMAEIARKKENWSITWFLRLLKGKRFPRNMGAIRR